GVVGDDVPRIVCVDENDFSVRLKVCQIFKALPVQASRWVDEYDAAVFVQRRAEKGLQKLGFAAAGSAEYVSMRRGATPLRIAQKRTKNLFSRHRRPPFRA